MVPVEERREIIEQAKQEFMIMLPEVIGNLMANHAAFAKMNSEFYKEHPEFRDHKDAVVSILSEIDGEDTLLAYEDKLKKAIPRIQERIRVIKGLSVNSVERAPNRDFSNFSGGGNGEL